MSFAWDEPIRLAPIFRERVWGRRALAPYFPDTFRDPIGEAWFTDQENPTSLGISLGECIAQAPGILGTGGDPTHPDMCPLLVKLLFTTERLSVQVHPDDNYAQLHHQSLGKTEAWYVVEAEPAAAVALGFCKRISAERLLDAVQTGEIEQLLDWRHVQTGDAIYTPAGTVHAIGAGLTICEIQENSDLTYRLYDYGRPRELHLKHGIAVAHLGPCEQQTQPATLAAGREQLVVSSYFRLERLRPAHSVRIARGLPHYALLICLRGSGTIAQKRFKAGECWFVPAGNAAFEILGENSDWLVSYRADTPADGIATA